MKTNMNMNEKHHAFSVRSHVVMKVTQKMPSLSSQTARVMINLKNLIKYFMEYIYLSRLRMASGEACISVTAQRPAPMSLRLAPIR